MTGSRSRIWSFRLLLIYFLSVNHFEIHKIFRFLCTDCPICSINQFTWWEGKIERSSVVFDLANLANWFGGWTVMWFSSGNKKWYFLYKYIMFYLNFVWIEKKRTLSIQWVAIRNCFVLERWNKFMKRCESTTHRNFYWYCEKERQTEMLFNARTRLNWIRVFELCTCNVSISK